MNREELLVLEQIANSLAKLVEIQNKRLELQKAMGATVRQVAATQDRVADKLAPRM